MQTCSKAMMLRKWDYNTKGYLPYEVPDEWILGLFVDDMTAQVNCTQCGKLLEYGVTYTSKEIHTQHGLGLAVCEECYQKEIERSERGRRREKYEEPY